MICDRKSSPLQNDGSRLVDATKVSEDDLNGGPHVEMNGGPLAQRHQTHEHRQKAHQAYFHQLRATMLKVLG